jgi:hypothetical protein
MLRGGSRAGARVAVDLEDLLSCATRPTAAPSPRSRALAVAPGAYAACLSLAMSQALATEYGCKPDSIWAMSDEAQSESTPGRLAVSRRNGNSTG